MTVRKIKPFAFSAEGFNDFIITREPVTVL